METHGEKCDKALRRILEAVAPLQVAMQEAAVHPGRVTAVTAAPIIWQRIVSAVADGEVWPLELLGPVPVKVNDEKGQLVAVEAWFTRGWHDPYRFMLHATRASRRLDGGAFHPREVPLGLEISQQWWAPPAPAKGRENWSQVPSYEQDAVPVTVWVNPMRRAA